MVVDPVPGGSLPPDQGRRHYAVAALARSCLVVVVLVLAYFLLPLTPGTAWGGVLQLVAGLTAVALVLAWHIRKILVSPYPAIRAMSTLVMTLPLFLTVFAAVYFMMGEADQENWSEPLTRLDAMYYTVTVFATVGFGDITAESQVARALTTVQMLLGLLFVGIIARVVVGAVQVNVRRSHRD